MKKNIFIKSIGKHNSYGDSKYIIYDLDNENVILEFKVKNCTLSQANYFGVCNAISLYPSSEIYTCDTNVIKWVENKKYNSKKYNHKFITKCDNLLQSLNFEPKVLIWDKKTKGNIVIKNKVSKTKNKELFDNSIIEKKHIESNLVCYTDGSGDNNFTDEPITFSFVIYENKEIIHKDKNICKDAVNTTIKAEIMGINSCLAFLITEDLQHEKITLFSDAKWVVDWVCNNLNWISKSTEAPYYKSFLEFRELRNEFSDIEFIWIPREYNNEADSLLR